MMKPMVKFVRYDVVATSRAMINSMCFFNFRTSFPSSMDAGIGIAPTIATGKFERIHMTVAEKSIAEIISIKPMFKASCPSFIFLENLSFTAILVAIMEFESVRKTCVKPTSSIPLNVSLMVKKCILGI